jgi:phosphoketolase
MSDSNGTKVEQKVVLTLADLQKVLNYVASRPYHEVFQVIETLKAAKTFDAVYQEAKALEQKVVSEVKKIEQEVTSLVSSNTPTAPTKIDTPPQS